MKLRKLLSMLLTLVMVLSVTCVGAMAATGDMSNPVSVGGVTLAFGDIDTPTWPESNMYFSETAANTYEAVYSIDGVTASSSYYPSILSFYAIGASSITGTDIDFVTYDVSGNPTVSDTTAVNADGFYTVQPKSDSSKIVVNGNITINFSAPNSSAASGGSTPSAVNGYLPIGQFARSNSFGWGTIFTDNTNVYDSTKTAKFLNGYVATGVSLGMLGGYVQFQFDAAIENDPANPYGIDFIVYGNAFNGNPEAGSVMVYGKNTATNAYGWYNLAGSRHYMDGTKWNEDISYIKIATKNTTIGGKTFAKAGIYTATDYNYAAVEAGTMTEDAAIAAASWGADPISTVATWWPEAADSENYAQVWKINNNANVTGVYWNTEGTAPVITYTGLTEVVDSDVTDDYLFGYADVRVNGSNYGTAVNPYASTPSSGAGGDGFDLAWAVDANGNPVELTDVHFVRVYSGVLYNAGVFGETSTEVCGIYVANGTGGSAATIAPTIKVGSSTVATSNMGTTTKKVYSSTAKISVTSTAQYIYVNGVQISSGDEVSIDTPSGSTNYVQIITQNGTESPYITVLKVTR